MILGMDLDMYNETVLPYRSFPRLLPKQELIISSRNRNTVDPACDESRAVVAGSAGRGSSLNRSVSIPSLVVSPSRSSSTNSDPDHESAAVLLPLWPFTNFYKRRP
jgi:hypothetical protein